MQLSYGWRLFCLVFASIGVLQAGAELSLRPLLPVFDRASRSLSARWTERLCFILPLVSHFTALALVLVIVAPQYIADETNLAQERVGWLCIMISLLVAVRYAYALVRALFLMLYPLPNGKLATDGIMADEPFWLVQSDSPLVAVKGILSPTIVISCCLLDNRMISSDAWNVALAHERAHLCQFDNLKLLILSSLETPLRSRSLVRRWRRAAEIAADEDAAAGNRLRALVLAETLLTVARAAPTRVDVRVLGLFPHEEDLELRVHRLLGEENVNDAQAKPRGLIGLAALLLCVEGLLLPFGMTSIHRCAEYLLHLG